MKNCYLCNIELNKDNKSIEHILLNSIGGRLKSSELLCKKCNSELGHSSDTELSKQLSFLASFIQVKRDKGKPQIIKGGKTKDGQKYNIIDGSKPRLADPQFETTIDGKNINYSIVARSEKELMRMMKDLKTKKHPEIDLKTIRESFNWEREYLNEHLHYKMSVGGDLAFKSLVKSAVNFYIHNQGNKKEIEHILPYLKNEKELEIAKHFHPNKTPYTIDENEIIHLIHLNGNKQSKILYCFIDLFSSLSFLILLSNNYSGETFSKIYAYDLTTDKEVFKEFKLKVDIEDLIFSSKMTNEEFTSITKRLKRVFSITLKKQEKKEFENIVDSSFVEIYEKFEKENRLNEIDDFSRELVEMIFSKNEKFQRRKKIKK